MLLKTNTGEKTTSGKPADKPPVRISGDDSSILIITVSSLIPKLKH